MADLSALRMRDIGDQMAHCYQADRSGPIKVKPEFLCFIPSTCN